MNKQNTDAKKVIVEELGSYFFDGTGKDWKTQMNADDKKDFIKDAEQFATSLLSKLPTLNKNRVREILLNNFEEMSDAYIRMKGVKSVERANEIYKIAISQLSTLIDKQQTEIPNSHIFSVGKHIWKDKVVPDIEDEISDIVYSVTGKEDEGTNYYANSIKMDKAIVDLLNLYKGGK